MKLLGELRRRNVIRMAGLYLVGSWLVVQVAGTVLPMFGAPGWVARSIVALLAVGFLPALVVAWVFELTPDGLKRDAHVDPADSIAPQTARRMDRAIIALLALALVYFGVDKFVLAPRRDAAQQVEASRALAAARELGRSEARAPAADTQSIAVLPFVNMSADPEQEYFSDGISEEILNALTQVDGLKVVGRTSSFQFKGRNEDLRAIGDKLGVAHLLEGSIRKQGDNVRITAQLIKVADGYHLWSETYDRKLTDIFAVQDEISAAIAQALSAQLMHAGPQPRASSIDPAAYDLYLRARQLMRKRNAPALREAGRLFDAASAIAPDFDAAYSGRARALSIVWNFAGAKEADTLVVDGMRAATRALELNPRNAEAHSALGYMQFIYQWQWEQGLRATRLAITLAPNDAEIANFAGDLFRFAGDLDAGLKWERRAIELDPLLAINHSDLSWALQGVNDCRAAIAPGRKALELDPNQTAALDALSRAQICLGEYEAAEVSLARFDSLEPDSPFLLDARARLAVRRGRDVDARKALRALAARVDAGAVFHYGIAQTQAALGDGDAAGRSLERAYAQRDPYFPADDLYLLPEEWPAHPAILAALDKPELKTLFAMRRGYFKAQKQRGFAQAGASAPPLSSPTR